MRKKRDWLYQIRMSKRMTHQEMADIGGISRPFYTLIENGDRNPHTSTAKQVAQKLNFHWTLFFRS